MDIADLAVNIRKDAHTGKKSKYARSLEFLLLSGKKCVLACIIGGKIWSCLRGFRSTELTALLPPADALNNVPARGEHKSLFYRTSSLVTILPLRPRKGIKFRRQFSTTLADYQKSGAERGDTEHEQEADEITLIAISILAE